MPPGRKGSDIPDGDDEFFIQTLDYDPEEDSSELDYLDWLADVFYGLRDRESLKLGATATKLKRIRGDEISNDDAEIEDIAKRAGVLTNDL